MPVEGSNLSSETSMIENNLDLAKRVDTTSSQSGVENVLLARNRSDRHHIASSENSLKSDVNIFETISSGSNVTQRGIPLIVQSPQEIPLIENLNVNMVEALPTESIRETDIKKTDNPIEADIQESTANVSHVSVHLQKRVRNKGNSQKLDENMVETLPTESGLIQTAIRESNVNISHDLNNTVQARQKSNSKSNSISINENIPKSNLRGSKKLQRIDPNNPTVNGAQSLHHKAETNENVIFKHAALRAADSYRQPAHVMVTDKEDETLNKVKQTKSVLSYSQKNQNTEIVSRSISIQDDIPKIDSRENKKIEPIYESLPRDRLGQSSTLKYVEKKSLRANNKEKSNVLSVLKSRSLEIEEDKTVVDLLGKTEDVVATARELEAKLVESARLGHSGEMKRLVREGVFVDSVNDLGYTPLMFCISRGSLDDVVFLLGAGAEPNLEEADGWTALMFAAFQGDLEIINILIDAGADVFHVSENGMTTYGAAATNNHLDIAAQLASIGVTEALIDGDGERMLKMIQEGADPDASSSTGWTALIFMVTRGDIEGSRAVINAGADVNKAENDGWTPLMIASEVGSIDLVKILLAAGADVYAQTMTGRTPLACAEAGRHVAVVKILQDHISRKRKIVSRVGHEKFIRRTNFI